MTGDVAEARSPSEKQVAQLLRLPGRSGLAFSPTSTVSYLNCVHAQPLTMYSNQVGGHGVLVKPKDSSVVLKPYDEAEFNFYDQLMPTECSCLIPYTARCYGEVDLRCTSPPDEISSPGAVPGKSGKYVMLDDLAHGIDKPCILDLKMGLKQRSVRNFSPKKLQSKSFKSLSTTSHQLGFRLGGAQLYPEGKVVFYNKYLGRQQDAAGTYLILREVFRSVSDLELRRDILAIFIHKLQELRAVIRRLRGFRFWSGSLLFVFDAASCESVVLKMIDFAHFTRLEDLDADFDREYDFGIDCLLRFLSGVAENENINFVLEKLQKPPDPAIQDKELLAAAIDSSPPIS